MKVIKLDERARDAFVNERRLGVLSSLRASGAPIALPLWYRWDGEEIETFSERHAPKVKRLAADPRCSLLVANNPDEWAKWVLFEGEATLDEDGGYAAASRLLERYHGSLDTPGNKAILDAFSKLPLVRIAFRPTNITTYAELHG